MDGYIRQNYLISNSNKNLVLLKILMNKKENTSRGSGSTRVKNISATENYFLNFNPFIINLPGINTLFYLMMETPVTVDYNTQI